MNEFHELLVRRHSIRKYTGAALDAEQVRTIMEAALLAPTSKNARSWEFTVVEERALLEQLSACKPLYGHSIARGALAIVVSADPAKSDVWIEDASVAAAFIHLQVEALGLGSCWVQVRGRMHDAETTAGEYVKDLLNMPAEQQVLCVLSVGVKDEVRRPVDLEKLKWEKVHIGKWGSEQ